MLLLGGRGANQANQSNQAKLAKLAKVAQEQEQDIFLFVTILAHFRVLCTNVYDGLFLMQACQ